MRATTEDQLTFCFIMTSRFWQVVCEKGELLKDKMVAAI